VLGALHRGAEEVRCLGRSTVEQKKWRRPAIGVDTRESPGRSTVKQSGYRGEAGGCSTVERPGGETEFQP
jgi:hypothetical protein